MHISVHPPIWLSFHLRTSQDSSCVHTNDISRQFYTAPDVSETTLILNLPIALSAHADYFNLNIYVIAPFCIAGASALMLKLAFIAALRAAFHMSLSATVVPSDPATAFWTVP